VPSRDCVRFPRHRDGPGTGAQLQCGGVAEIGEAIRAVQVDNGAGIGVDVSNLAALTEHPWRQLGAAIVDAGLIYGAYMGADALAEAGNDNDTENHSAGGDLIQIQMKDNAVLNIGNTTQTSPAE